MFKKIYTRIIREINIFLERPYTDSNGKYLTNGNLQAIIEREIELEHPKSASDIKLISYLPN